MALLPKSSSVKFTVSRREPELVAPAKATPREWKLLSDIDDQQSLRFQIPGIQFYRRNDDTSLSMMREKDPVKVIREALAEALVFYYPFAGRLREGAGGKLMVECTGEGVLFIEADADVELSQFGDALLPPFPCLEELLYDVPGSEGILNCPLLLIQVTRLLCGGFIFALRLNHTMSDAAGLIQFMMTIAQIARGARAPSVLPVWQRELLSARDPPRVTFTHREYDKVTKERTTIPQDDMTHRSFFFGPTEVLTLRRLVSPHLHACSKLDLVIACVWRCRTIALQLNPDAEVRFLLVVNTRAKFNPSLPAGYYGNTFVFPAVLSTVGELCKRPLVYAVELVTKLKSEVTEEYVKSVADLMVTSRRRYLATARAYLVSDVTRAGFEEVDFGWGKAVYGGPAKGSLDGALGVVSFYVPSKNNKGENGIVVPVSLPARAMEKFMRVLNGIITGNEEAVTCKTSTRVRSLL